MNIYKNIQTALRESELNYFVLANSEIQDFETLEDAEKAADDCRLQYKKLGIKDGYVDVMNRDKATEVYL